MNYKRIFTFGCSFTDWLWPTWADVLAYQSNIPVFNGAKSGIGNDGIACRIVEYDQRFKFNEEDLIIVMWTSWTRESRFLNGRWYPAGNVLNNDFYDDRFVKKYWDWENDIIKNSSAMILTNKSYNIGANYFALGMLEVDEIPHSPLIDLYRNSLPTGPRFQDNRNFFNGNVHDQHPDILNHVEFYNEHVASRFNFPSVEPDSIFHTWQDYLTKRFNLKQTDKIQKEFVSDFFNKHRSKLSIK